MNQETNLSLNSSWGTGTTHRGQTNITGGGWYTPDYYQPVVQYYYPAYQWYWHDKDKISKAFKLVEKFIEKKTIKEPKTVKAFIELVNSISEII